MFIYKKVFSVWTQVADNVTVNQNCRNIPSVSILVTSDDGSNESDSQEVHQGNTRKSGEKTCLNEEGWTAAFEWGKSIIRKH